MVKKLCPRCGAVQSFWNTWNWYCRECGLSFKEGTAEEIIPYDAAARGRLHRKWERKQAASMIVSITLILLIVMFIPACSSTMKITVSSANSGQNIDYQILVNGVMEGQGTLAPGQNINWSIQYNFPWAFSGQKLVIVEGIGIGSSVGLVTDLHYLTLVNGDDYAVTLNV